MTTLNIDLFQSAGNLYWYRHGGQHDGTVNWDGKNLVGQGGWEQYVSVFGAGNNIIYAVGRDGNLYWYRHDGQQDGSGKWPERKLVGQGGWQGYVSVFATGNFIYAIDREGDLYWYRHDGQAEGTQEWSDRKLVKKGGIFGLSWKGQISGFASGNIIYTVENEILFWHRHDGQQDGTDRWSEILVASPWRYVFSFAAGNIIYAVASDGKLYWHRHDGQQDGQTMLGQKGKLVGSGWLMYKSVFAADGGIVYGMGADTMSWMSMIPSGRKLNEFTIPGTHDTGTWTADEGNRKCQTLSLNEQLNAGIRFIDIRVKQLPNPTTAKPDFGIYHGHPGGFMGLYFSTDIVNVCKQFLSDHPTETIIMSVKDEGGSTDDFEANLARYLTDDICLKGTAVPSLAEARGRIVLFRRYEFGTAGIPARANWPDDETGEIVTAHNTLKIQDVYGYGFPEWDLASDQAKRDKLDKKWSFVKQYLEKAVTETDPQTWVINFASASGPPGILNPVDFAKGGWGHAGINSTMNSVPARPGNYGAVLMDYPEYPDGGEVIRRLIRVNVHN